jgi:hypothetical protein
MLTGNVGTLSIANRAPRVLGHVAVFLPLNTLCSEIVIEAGITSGVATGSTLARLVSNHFMNLRIAINGDGPHTAMGSGEAGEENGSVDRLHGYRE